MIRLINADKLNIDELCRLRSDLKSGLHVGSTLRTQGQINKYIKALDDVIDNAPAVEPPEIQALMSDYLVYRSEPERPKGRWVATNETDEFYGRVYKCSNCGKELLACGCRDYCTWCGTEMEK